MIRVGIIGTGYAAQKRAEALALPGQGRLIAVAGSDPERTATFGARYGALVTSSWQALLDLPEIDLVIIATVNSLHGTITRATLMAQKHVVVEYPLALVPATAAALIALAQTQKRLLHVEHIELLGGLHQAAKAYLPRVGTPLYVNYRTLNPKRPAPQKWSFHPELAGFPLISALSRVHRLTNLLGKVSQVYCHSRFLPAQNPVEPYYGTCLCSAQLQFDSGVVSELTYGKGEGFWNDTRRLEIQGTQGSLVFDQDQGKLVTAQGEVGISVTSRQGLFAQDTAQVLDFLTTGKPLYVTPQASLYALTVADALRQSSESGQPVAME